MLQPLYLQHSTERRCVSADLVIDKSINGPLAYHIKGFTYTNTSTGKKVCLQKIVLLCIGTTCAPITGDLFIEPIHLAKEQC